MPVSKKPTSKKRDFGNNPYSALSNSIVPWEDLVGEKLADLLEARGYKEPFPPQESAVRSGLLQGRNMIISSPTSSGKTLIAEIAIANIYMNDPTSKALYLVPLKAIASEKSSELSSAWKGLGLRVATTTGDYESKDEWLASYNLIIATNEKADSLLRQRPTWLNQIKVVVVDEIHLINEESRGPTLEAVLARLRRLLPRAQIIAMSATIGNPEELAEWLGAVSVVSDWRPVPLKIGVMKSGIVEYEDGLSIDLCSKTKEEKNSALYLRCLAEDTLREGGQFLVFANSRRNAVKMAKDLSPVTDRYAGRPELERIAKKIFSLDSTELAKELGELVEKGVAFHHAGLSPEQRKLIEDAFKGGLIKGIVATPTLAAGVNLPARRVIVPSLVRYEAGYGMAPISVIEFKQFCGRAGRPQYDDHGEAIAFFNGDAEEFFEAYVRSPPESIAGHLLEGEEVSFQTLASVASGYEDTKDGITEFFKGSFSGVKYSREEVAEKVDNSLNYLEKEGFVKYDGLRYIATPFGKRTAELYIKPLTAAILRAALRSFKQDTPELLYVYACTITPDSVTVRARESEEQDLDKYFDEVEGEGIGQEFRDFMDLCEDPLSSLKTALVVRDWMNEVGFEAIESKYSVQPGDLYQVREAYQWIFYSAFRLSSTIKRSGIGERYYRFSVRVKEGIKEELIPIIGLRGIGRVRARILYENGIKTVDDFLKTDDSLLLSLPTFGPEIIRQAKESAQKQANAGGRIAFV